MALSTAIKNLITATVPQAQEYLIGIRNDITGLANVTIRALFQWMLPTYGRIGIHELEENTTKLKEAWDVNTPIFLLIEIFRRCQQYADAGEDPFSEQNLLNQLLRLVQNTGAYPIDVREWNRRPAAEKSLHNLILAILDVVNCFQNTMILIKKCLC